MVTLINIKTYLWIVWTSQDTRLQLILDWINESVKNYCWDLSYWEKTIKVKNIMVKNYTIWLLHKKAVKITSINWNDFNSKVAWVDYIINDSDEIIINDVYNYIQNDFWIFELKYNAWYSTAPNNLIAIVSDLVWLEFSKRFWKDITREELWERTTIFDITESKEKLFKKLNCFIPLHLQIW